ncbi:MAG: iron-sulfur cluster co-chaperone HscB C-terminal domain-containing protein [Flavitalea sp.]
MNYFELYGIPVALSVDAVKLKKRFYELSREFHPDLHSQEGEKLQEEVLQKSADINRAYRIFQNEDATIRYVLMMMGLMEEEEKYALNPDFLGEVMDINEQLMELEMEPDEAGLAKAEEESNQLLSKIYGDVELVIKNYKEGVSSEEELLRVKGYYYRKKYLQRILDKISQLRNIATL